MIFLLVLGILFLLLVLSAPGPSHDGGRRPPNPPPQPVAARVSPGRHRAAAGSWEWSRRVWPLGAAQRRPRRPRPPIDLRHPGRRHDPLKETSDTCRIYWRPVPAKGQSYIEGRGYPWYPFCPEHRMKHPSSY